MRSKTRPFHAMVIEDSEDILEDICDAPATPPEERSFYGSEGTIGLADRAGIDRSRQQDDDVVFAAG